MDKLKDGMEYKIRKVEVEDAEKVLEYMKRAGGESDFLSFGEGELAMTVEDEIKYIEGKEGSDNSLFLLAEKKGEVIGTIGFNGGTRARNRHTGQFGISVAKAYWGNGVGSNLLKEMLLWAESSPVIEKIELDVYENNYNAQNMYRKYGFEVEGRKKMSYKIGEEYYDAVLMGKVVK